MQAFELPHPPDPPPHVKTVIDVEKKALFLRKIRLEYFFVFLWGSIFYPKRELPEPGVLLLWNILECCMHIDTQQVYCKLILHL